MTPLFVILEDDFGMVAVAINHIVSVSKLGMITMVRLSNGREFTTKSSVDEVLAEIAAAMSP